MFITAISLGDFKRLQFAQIKELHIDTSHSSSQLILGTNGSGKSSVLRELFPTTPTKSGFSTDGFKTLSLNHRGLDYELTYQPRDGHQFFRDGIQLNTSMTNDVQRALINEHLGVSPEIQNILTCSFNICDTVPSVRKKILMSLNPVDVSLFIDEYQNVRKKTLSLSNNLDRLYQRQKQLVEQKIPQLQYDKMIGRKSVLEDQEKILLIWSTRISDELNKYPLSSTSVSVEQLRSRLESLIGRSRKVDNVPRTGYSEHRTENTTRVNILRSELTDLESQIEKVIKTIDSYEQRRSQLNSSSGDLVSELTQYKTKIAGMVVDTKLVPLSREVVMNIQPTIDRINKLLVDLTYIEYDTICSRDVIMDMSNELLRLQSRIQITSNDLNATEDKIDSLKASIRVYRLGDPCDAVKCELLRSYNQHFETKKKEIDTLIARRTALKSEHDKLIPEYESLKGKHEIQLAVWRILGTLLDTIKQHGHLSIRFSDDYIIGRIAQAPLQLINDINRYITDSEYHHEYINTLAKIDKLEREVEGNQARQQLSIEILDIEITKYTDSLTDLRTKCDMNRTSIETLSSEIRLIDEFTECVEIAKVLADDAERTVQYASNQASVVYLNKLNHEVEKLQHSVRSELLDLTRLIREQETLLARLDQEVDQVISEIKPMYERSKKVERALFELPVKYTKTFVNSIIDTANYFIRELMTYSLVIEPYTDERECDFTLPVTIEHDVKSKDINTCSDGQKAIINLAFNLALIVELKYNDYPIYVDEIDRALDPTHSHRLTKTLNDLITKDIISQMFVANHHQSMIDGVNGDIIILNGDNINLPTVYNEHVKIVN